ncbi:hypothetical protein BDZ91DRAFT_395641 [Kalaharituber pfeilii]|nr:hypothetical protein BDZ91DRAFT_395641 [Kalaharituber pfeilii]
MSHISKPIFTAKYNPRTPPPIYLSQALQNSTGTTIAEGSFPHPLQTVPQEAPWREGKALIRVRLLVGGICLGAAAATAVSHAEVLRAYVMTREGTNLWPDDPIIWPTTFMVVIACISATFHIYCFASHFFFQDHSQPPAPKILRRRHIIRTISHTILAVLWLLGTLLGSIFAKYNVSQGRDIWSWSCKYAPPEIRMSGWSGEGGVRLWTVCWMATGGRICSYLYIILEAIYVWLYPVVNWRLKKAQKESQPEAAMRRRSWEDGWT